MVDVRDAHSGCRNTFVYVADCQTYSIIVYDVQKNRSWRVTDKTMYPYPNYGTFNILEDSFDLMDGVLGMSLSPYKPGQERILFYHAMSSPTENWVKTSDLRNRTRFLHDPLSSPEIFHVRCFFPKTSPSLILLSADVQRRKTHSIRRRSHRQRRNHVLRNDERRHIELLEHQDGVRTRDHRSHQQKSRDAAVRQRHQSELVILVIVSWYIFSRSLPTPGRCKSCGR
jgi:hypothetical protein